MDVLGLIKFLLFLLFVLPLTALASSPITVALTPIPNVLDKNNKALPYSKLLELIKAQVKAPVSYQYMQSDRAIRLFDKNKVNCIFPTMKHEPDNNMRFSKPINGIALYLFSLNKKYRSLAELNNKLVVYLRGYEFDLESKENPKVNFFSASDHNLAIDMLKNDRASAYLAYFPDIRVRTFGLTKPVLQFEQNSPLYQSYDSFYCRKSADSERFLSEVDQLITKMSKKGELKAILGDYHQPISQ